MRPALGIRLTYFSPAQSAPAARQRSKGKGRLSFDIPVPPSTRSSSHSESYISRLSFSPTSTHLLAVISPLPLSLSQHSLLPSASHSHPSVAEEDEGERVCVFRSEDGGLGGTGWKCIWNSGLLSRVTPGEMGAEHGKVLAVAWLGQPGSVRSPPRACFS